MSWSRKVSTKRCSSTYFLGAKSIRLGIVMSTRVRLQGRIVRLLLFTPPQFVEKAALFHLFQIAAVDERFGLDVFSARIHLGDLVEDALDTFGLDRQSRLHRLDFDVVGGVQNLPVGHAQILSQNLVGEFLVRMNNLRGLRHGAHELSQNLGPLGERGPQSNKGRGRVWNQLIGTVDQIMEPLGNRQRVGGRIQGGGIQSARDERRQGLRRSARLDQLNVLVRIQSLLPESLNRKVMRVAPDAVDPDLLAFQVFG